MAPHSAIADAATTSTPKHKTHAVKRAANGTTGATGAGGRAHNETPLTGDTLKRASDAAIAANPGATVDRASTEDPAEGTGGAYEVKITVPGGTVDRASTEDPAEGNGAAYDVHVTKADGSRVEVLLDSSFGVVKTVADQDPGGPRHR